MKTTPELLAPAGDLNAAITAFENGADAVYAGLGKFNARERTENFSFEEYGKLMAYAAKHGKKVYLTFNTLIKEDEVQEALDMLSRITRLLPDAVIVQDIGVIALLKRYFPHIPIHASTQMGIHNSAGMAWAKSWGIERVILERQISMEELMEIQKHAELETEVFIHGALCCSLSGVCLFSSWMGGHSGNRGKCKQPCRRRYFSPDGNGFFFSMNDLYMLEDIPALKRAGVHSLKIEGRLRKSDYVAAVVQAYRMMLDTEEKDIPSVLPEARAILSGALGRKWSSGFYEKANYGDIIESDRLGVSGKHAGRVTGLSSNGFTLQALQPLKLGDKIRVQPKSGEEGPAVTITKITKNGKPATRIGARESGFIHCDKAVANDGMVYKIGASAKEYGRLIEQLPAPEFLLRLQIDVAADSVDVLVAQHPHLPACRIAAEFPPAENRAVDADAFISEFMKAGNERIGVKTVSAEVQGDFFISQRDIRKLRQAFDHWLNEHYVPVADPVFIAEAVSVSNTPAVHTLAVRNAAHLPRGFSYDALAVTEDPKNGEAVILPAFCPEDALSALKARIARLVQGGVTAFRVTALYQFELLKAYPGLTLHTSFPLPVTNSPACDMLLQEGAKQVQLWVELEETALKTLAARYGGAAEIYRYGRLPILQTRAKLPVSGAITDARGAGFTVVPGDPLTELYPEAVFSIPTEDFPPVSTCTDLTYAKPGEKTVSRFNFDREMA
ncbi:MAG: U32 family peptidase [Candidatus Marinimicrobia bacterium]|nr:U32 family peptidase [Candidatus Neomarinimicrobiota bacterium]